MKIKYGTDVEQDRILKYGTLIQHVVSLEDISGVFYEGNYYIYRKDGLMVKTDREVFKVLFSYVFLEYENRT